MLNVICLVGRLVADPDYRTTTNGVPTARIRIAVDRDFVRQGEERQADFFDVICWRQTADFVNRFFHKGSWIAVNGSMQTRSYDDRNGVRRMAYEVIASNVSFCSSRENNGSGNGSYQSSRPAEPQQPAPSFSNTDGTELSRGANDDNLPF